MDRATAERQDVAVADVPMSSIRRHVPSGKLLGSQRHRKLIRIRRHPRNISSPRLDSVAFLIADRGSCAYCEEDRGICCQSRRQRSPVLSSPLFAGPKSGRPGVDTSHYTVGRTSIASFRCLQRQAQIILQCSLAKICASSRGRPSARARDVYVL
jgi:hypothetical protein